MSPDQSPEALIQNGELSLFRNHPEAALRLFEQALLVRPRDSAAWRGLGKAQLELGARDEARQSFAEALAIVPYDRYAAHMLAALSGNSDARAGGYVAELFDSYADQFDGHLGETLGYRIPQLLAERLAARGPFASLLDLGCGTGLVGAALAGMVAEMDGIDIAPNMVRKARERDLYRHLRTGDTLQVLASDPDLAGPYDLVTAADVFVYVGQLETTFAAVARILAPRGLFAFSIELSLDDSVALRPSGRYAHSDAYVRTLAVETGLVMVEAIAHPIRNERDRPIPGMLYVLTPMR